VRIRDFVAKLARLDPSLGEDELYKCCSVLDRDGNGSITLDEFLEFFGDPDAVEDDMKNAEEELQDELWPDWLIKEGKLQHAQTLLAAMHQVLEAEHGISAEQAFGIYDMKDSGDCSTAEFERVLKIFFAEALPKKEDQAFLMKLTQKKGDGRVDYRDFCKFLSKRVVRTFKTGGSGLDSAPGKEMTALERELAQPLRKDATLSYVLRKAAQLNLDVRKALLSCDKGELSVLPRSKFAGLLLDLPLGLSDSEVQEIMENDISFHNYGNVEYTAVLNSDIFCTLER